MIPRHVPPRTRWTDLTDDDLLLLDAVFDSAWPVKALRRDEYGFHLNVSYSHSLSDDALEARIADLVDRALLTSKVADPIKGRNWSYCAMTPDGGALWELERQPDWDRYCRDTWGDETVTFDAYCLEAALACMRDFDNCGFVEVVNAKPVVVRHGMESPAQARPLVAWRTSKEQFSVVVAEMKASGSCPLPDNARANRNAERCWWRDASELSALARRGSK